MGKLNNLINQQFGRLKVIGRAPNKNNKVYWLCECDCGTILPVRSDQLTRGVTRSCGCYHKEIAMKIGQNNFKDLTNQTFGKLTAKKFVKKDGQDKYYWICECECGNTVEVLGTSLTNGNTRSCGCIKSLGESIIKNILQNNNYNFKDQYFIKIDDKNYFYDFALLNNNNQPCRFIEFDGPQHMGRISGWFTSERYKNLLESDKIKNNYAIKNNIPLIRIPYSEKNNITLEMIMGNNYLVNGLKEEVNE